MNDVIIFCAKYLVFLIPLIAVAYWLRLNRKLKIQMASAMLIAAVVAYALIKVGGKLYYHPRPFIAEHIQPLVSHGNDNSFPSEHTTLAMAIASIIYLYSKKLGYILLALVLAVGLGRIGAHVHYPVDILGGLVFGALAAKVGYDLAKTKLSAGEPTK